MKKVVLSALAATIVSSAVYADSMTLFTDPKTGQVFTTAGEGRVEMGDFIDAKSVDMQLRDSESKFSEYADKQSKYVNVKSKAKTLEFSGTHYLGYTNTRPSTVLSQNNGDQAKYAANSGGFEMRRNYVQVKAYFNDKDYVRVTMDTTKELAQAADAAILTTSSTNSYTTTSQNSGFADVFVKYAYLYLDKVLPYTGVEAGIVHRPWIDYEEHNSWLYRSFNKVALEEKGTPTESGVDLVNSADFGINFQTKTDMFSSEIGIFNGEGYHADKGGANQANSQAMSAEWRLTAHLIGSGEKVGKNDITKDTYLNISTMGLISNNHKDDKNTLDQSYTDALKGEYDRQFYGIHAVYNQPEFLIAAQYVIAEDEARNQYSATNQTTAWEKREYDLFSVNAEYRPLKDWTVIGRYDNYKWDDTAINGTAMSSSVEGDKKIVALAYKMNKNVSFIGSAKFIDEEYTVTKTGATSPANYIAGSDTGESKDVYMLTTEIKW